MQDPLITLLTLLKDNWTLTGELAKENIRFSTGWIDEDFQGPQIVITSVTDMKTPQNIGYEKIFHDAVYQIDIFVPILRETGKGPGKAKANKWAMTQEVERILKANLKATDLWYLLYSGVSRDADELDREPPVLRKIIEVNPQWITT